MKIPWNGFLHYYIFFFVESCDLFLHFNAERVLLTIYCNHNFSVFLALFFLLLIARQTSINYSILFTPIFPISIFLYFVFCFFFILHIKLFISFWMSMHLWILTSIAKSPWIYCVFHYHSYFPYIFLLLLQFSQKNKTFKVFNDLLLSTHFYWIVFHSSRRSC